MAGSERRRGASADDWLQAGFAILAEDGFTSLKIDSLSARLGMTKGSFYWHFTDMAAYKAALVSAWAQWRDDDHREFSGMQALPPRERLIEMTAFLVSPRQWMLERAMREWARTDRAAARSVRAADRRAGAAVRQAFIDLGFDDDVAEQRAQWLFAIGIGALHLSGSKSPQFPLAQREALVDFMLRP
ncbi:TetR/AcrR family transcriptional regulator [Mycolicibacterium sp. 018/SC-01/001]|uniref:TetR/AcrR family transcriptional regulator n=1 Tax=Mycolicibacterium sp. 018/SC-01/001 TaxID=2592069 RepID=UPI00118170F5|nr:TetR/AcrR family transcriptional regulator [Mycolicibacterium sp. 018/SC-01/001]TRW86125.1 TetR/AcrR family transcriptional regulator [Mycolicibacterium sp. 018/SC-01/001]